MNFTINKSPLTTETIDIPLSSVVCVGIAIHPIYKRNGAFKKWGKYGYIQTTDSYWKVTERKAKELKQVLVSSNYKLDTSKNTREQYKESARDFRRATEWKWRVDK